MGCWKDTWDRAIPLIEKKHPMLYEDDYKTRTNALMKCAEAALDNNFGIFSVQNGGQCFSGKDADKTYMKYGVSDSCKGKPSSFQPNGPLTIGLSANCVSKQFVPTLVL